MATAFGQVRSLGAVELPLPETLAFALERNSSTARPLFTSLAGVASLGNEYREVLLAALTNADPNIRLYAALGLSATGHHDEAVVREILATLASPMQPYPSVEEMIAPQSLALQGARALPILSAALRHDSIRARWRALQVVAQVGSHLQALLPDVAPAGQVPSDKLATLALFAKWRLDGDDHFAVERLVPLLLDKRECQCGGAVDYLAKMGAGAGAAVPALISAMETHRAPAVIEALDELFPHFPEQILPALKRGLNDPNLADNVAAALQHHEGPTDYLLPHLVRMMNAEGDQAIERHELARILAKYGAEAAPAIPGLMRALRSPSGQTRINAAETLGEIGARAADALPALREVQEEAVVAAAIAAAVLRIESAK